MDKHLKTLVTLCSLVAMIVAGLSYFATKAELNNVYAEVQQNSDQLNYQSTLRQYEFLLKMAQQHPEDDGIRQRLKEVEKRLKYFECRLFDQGCEK